MISHEHKLIFIHNRKCAGTSIKKLLGVDKKNPDSVFLQDGLCDPRWHTERPRFSDYMTFCVIRNPWDKFVSAWKYLEAYREKDILWVLKNLPDGTGDAQNRHDFRHITRLQTDLIADHSGKLVVDGVIKFEEIPQSIALFAREHSLDIDINHLPHSKKNRLRSPKDYRAYFCPEARNLFAERFARDIELLGYRF